MPIFNAIPISTDIPDCNMRWTCSIVSTGFPDDIWDIPAHFLDPLSGILNFSADLANRSHLYRSATVTFQMDVQYEFTGVHYATYQFTLEL